MTHSTFIAPYCYRARCDNAIFRDLQRPSDNEGFFFVLCGVIEIHHEAKELLVYEKEEWRNGQAPALLAINLSDRLTNIEFQLIRSRSSRYEAGRIRITCLADRGFVERITLKMTQETYRRIGRLLVSIGI